MSTRVCVGTTIKNVSAINTFVNGQRREITSAWTFVNGQIKQLWPNTETWTLIAYWASGESYSVQLGFGRYLIQMSGGGGSGSSIARRSGQVQNRSQQNGFSGEYKDFIVTVPHNNTYTISGLVGTGATGSHTYARSSYSEKWAGNPGSGYQYGSAGTVTGTGDTLQLAAGSGGGSTSFYVNGSLWAYARGGNGGSCSIQYYVDRLSHGGTWKSLSATGGAGGSGGITNGTGAAGGAATYGEGTNSSNTSGAGGNGWVRIYKSSLYM